MPVKRQRFAARRKAVGFSQEQLAERLGIERSTVGRWESGETEPQPWSRPKLARALQVSVDELDDLLTEREPAGEDDDRLAYFLAHPGSADLVAVAHLRHRDDDELAALELARRAEASEIGNAVVERLELMADELASAYQGTAPADLLGQVRAYLDYLNVLLGTRSTLAQHRRLLVTGGWLSLLAATCLIDLHQDRAAGTHLRTAASLADETGHAEIQAWCLETRAWQVLTAGDYALAVEIAVDAQRVAPRQGSAYIQATAQEGRAWARLGAQAQARGALARVEKLASPLPVPDQPEHHYRYDPAKSEAYLATTLSWLGDPAAVPYARDVLIRLESAAVGPPRPRRAASARLDLSLALITSGQHDEAAATALHAITSGRLVPSNYWRAREVIDIITDQRPAQARELAEAYHAYCNGNNPPASA